MKLFIFQFITIIVHVGGNGVIPKIEKIEPVAVLKDLSNGHNVVGKKMELECQTTFYAKYVSIEWKTPRNDIYTNLNLRKKTNSIYVTTSTLMVEEAGFQHSGLYICEIIHKQLNYQLTIKKIWIRVYGKDKHSLKINPDAQVKDSLEIEFMIQAHPHVSVDWINEDQEIIKNSSKTVVSLTQTYDGEYNYKAKLTFKEISFDKSYTIIVNNGFKKLNKTLYFGFIFDVDFSFVTINKQERTALYQCRAPGRLRQNRQNITWIFQPCNTLRCLLDDTLDKVFAGEPVVLQHFKYEGRNRLQISYVSVNLTDVGILKCTVADDEVIKPVFHTYNQFKYFVDDEGNFSDKRLEVEYRQIVKIRYTWSLYKYSGNVFWYHNGQIINEKKMPYFKTVTHTFSDTALGELSFDFVIEDQLGNFTCQILTRTGKLESKTIEVVSKNMSSLFPTISFLDLNEGHTTVGQDIRLVCNVTSYRREKINWWFNQEKHIISGVKLETMINDQKIIKKNVETVVDSNIYISTNYLTITQANTSETGYYGCGLVHNESSHYNDFIWVQIYDVNETSLTFEETNEFDMYNMNIKVLIMAHPSPTIKWFDNHENEIVFGHSNFVLSFTKILDRRGNEANYKATLRFNSINIEDFGNYTIVAENEHGKINYSVQINVTGKPSIPKIDIYNRTTKNVTLRCSSTAHPRPKIKWRINKSKSKQLWSENNGLQHISYISGNFSEGEDFVCESSNFFGESFTFRPISGSDTKVRMYIGPKDYSNYSNKSCEIIGETRVIFVCIASKLKYMNKFTTSRISYEGNSYQIDVPFDDRDQIRDSELAHNVFRADITVKSPSNNFYSCNFLKNGFLKSQTFHVRSEVSPYINILRTNLTNISLEVEVLSKWTFYCYFEGFPTPNLTWYKNDQGIVDSDKFKFSNDGQVLEIDNLLPEDEGIYRCKAFNTYTEITNYIILNVVVVSNPWPHVQIILVSCAVFFIAILTFLKFQKYRKITKKLESFGLFYSGKNTLHHINSNLTIEDQAALLPFDQKWEIPFQNIITGKQLGSGAFGVTFQANVVNYFPDDPNKTVAVKTVNPASGFECVKALVSELKILSHLGSHVNIVNFLGACTRRLLEDELYVVLEFCSLGNLLEYIKKHNKNFTDHKDYDSDVFNWDADDDVNSDNKSAVSSKNFLVWAFQVAKGMEYLSSRRVVHGDLAARNVLLTDKNVVKVCDFGLASKVYNYGNYIKKSQSLLPIKWMAVEAIQKGICSTQSDVWSFGILLWELFSLGKTPYCGVTVDETFCEKLINGYRMKQPETATSNIYQLMLDCWQLDPLLRPSFTEIGKQIGSFLEDTVKNYYITMNDSYILMNKQQFKEDSDYLAMVIQPTYQNLMSKFSENHGTENENGLK